MLAASEGSALAQQSWQHEFSVQRFEPAPGPNNFLGVETLRMEGDWHWSAGLFFNYSRDPFVVSSCTSPTSSCSASGAAANPDTHVVRDMLTWDLMASVSPRPWFQLGLRIPISYVSGDGLYIGPGPGAGGPLPNGFKAGGVGDPTIEGKFRLFGKPGSPLVLGAGAEISFAAHSLSDTNFIGDSSPVTGGIRGIVEGQVGAFSYGANLRGIFREDVSLQVQAPKAGPDTVVGSEFRYGVAAGYQVSPIFQVLVEGFGGTGFRSEPGSNSLEVDGAVRIRPLDTTRLHHAGRRPRRPPRRRRPPRPRLRRAPVLQGDGRHRPRRHPRRCRQVPHRPRGLRRLRGPLRLPRKPDNDGDRIPDDKDLCPNEPETINGFQDADGCPDEVP